MIKRNENIYLFTRNLILLTILLLFLFSIYLLQPLLISIVLGIAFAIPLLPSKEALQSSFNISKNLSSFIIVFIFTLLISAPISFLTYEGVRLVKPEAPNQQSDLSKVESEAVHTIAKKAAQFQKSFGFNYSWSYLQRQSKKTMANFKTFCLQQLAKFMQTLPDFFLQLVIFLISMFGFLTSYKKIYTNLLQLHIYKINLMRHARLELSEICKDVLFANIITGLTQALLVTLGTIFFTNYDPVIIFILTFIFSFVPMIGAGPFAALLALFQLISENYSSAISLGLLSLVVGVADNFLRSILIGQGNKKRPIINFFAVLGGIYTLGIPGVFLGPLFVNLTISWTPLLIKSYFSKPDNKFI